MIQRRPCATQAGRSDRRHRRSLTLLGAAFAITVVACTDATPPTSEGIAPNPHRADSIGTVRQVYDGALPLDLAVNTFRNIDRLFPTRAIHRAAAPSPLPRDPVTLGPVPFTSHGTKYELEDYVRLNNVTGLLVLHDGRIKFEGYYHGNTDSTRWMSMSVAKSITSTLIGAAVRQHRIDSIGAQVVRYVPALKGSAYDGATIRDVLMMSSGVKWIETYTDSTSDRRHLLEAQIAQQPGGALNVMKALPRAYPPGTHNTYNTGETQVAAEILQDAIGGHLAPYLEDRIWHPMGMEGDATWWVESPNGVEIGGSGFAARLRDYGRFGLFVLHNGIVGTDTILPQGWVHEATTPRTLKGGAPLDYGYLWWPAETEAGKKDEAFSADGIFGQFVYVNPTTNVVIVVWSAWPKPTEGNPIRDWDFFDAVSAKLR